MSQRYETHLEKAREFYEDGNYAAARAAAEKACSCVSEDLGDEARLILARCYQKLEYSEEAFKVMTEIVSREPSAEACAEFALMCAERGQCDAQCREFAHRSIEADPDMATAYLALFFCDVADDAKLDALHNLKKCVVRGGQVPEQKSFELLREWCQDACRNERHEDALALSSEVVDAFSSLDFFLLHARLCEVCHDDRQAVKYYKSALHNLPAGGMRNDVLEAIARIAI